MSDQQPELFASESAEKTTSDPGPSVPETPDESIQLQGVGHDRPVRHHLNTIEENTRKAANILYEKAGGGKPDSWNAAISNISAKFADDLKSCGFSEESKFDSRRSAWLAVQSLRAAIVQDVYAALEDLISQTMLTDDLQEVLSAHLDEVRSLSKELPEVIERREPGALFHARETDSAFLTARKFGVRMQRGIQAVTGKKEYRQKVFMRKLVNHHLETDVFPVIVDGVETVLKRDIAALNPLEYALMDWMHAVLDAERELDEFSFHIPHGEGIPELAEDEINSGAPVAKKTRASEDASKEQDSEEATNGDEEDEKEHFGYREAVTVLREANASLKLAFSKTGHSEDNSRQDEFQNLLDAGFKKLHDGVQSSDTFMSEEVRNITDNIAENAENSIGIQLEPRLLNWMAETADRIRFCLAMFSVQTLLKDVLNDLVEKIGQVSIVPISKAHEKSSASLEQLHQEAENIFDQALRLSDYSGLEDRLIEWQEKGELSVQKGVVEIIGSLPIKEGVAGAVEQAKESCTKLPLSYPEQYSVHEIRVSREKQWESRADRYALELRQYLAVGLDEALYNRIDTAPADLLNKIKDVLKGASEIPDVLEFNFGAAREELRGEGEAKPKNRGGEDIESSVDAGKSSEVKSARELVINGLARSSELLISEKDRLALPLYNVAQDLYSAFNNSWRRIHDRARVENQVRKYILGARSSLEDQKRRVSDTILSRLREAGIGVHRLARISRKKLKDLIRLGRAAVGEPEHQELTFQETVEALSTLDELLEAVPQVYRRLFSFNPVSDPDLLVGRKSDRLIFAKHIQKWRNGVTQSILLSGAPSSGRTSLLNVLIDTVFRDAEVFSLVLKERILDETALTKLLLQTLGKEITGGKRPTTLADLTSSILSTPPTGDLRICIVEHIEHLYLREIGGSEIVARLLVLMSRTDSRVLWVCTISEFGLQYIQANESASVALVRKHQLTRLDRESMEKLIINRHRKSGLKVEFKRGEVINPLIRRRLKKARSAEVEQSILREIYFDRLSTQCGQNIMLALYYWIRSITVNEDESGVLVAPLVPIKFAFLGAFSLKQAVALKALLDHASLTVEEFARISQTEYEESLAIFESLGNALLIEGLEGDAKPDHFHFLTVQKDVRYRIRPLTVHPVIQFLRGKNIVH